MPVINPFGVIAGTVSAGTTKATLGELVFSNSNGVSFGIDGQTITASAVGGGGGGNTGSLSAGTTQATLGQVVFSNSNGLSFGVNGQTITGSYTVPSTAGLLSAINVSGGTTSQNLSNVVFSNGNNVSFGLNGSTITGSVATSLTGVNVSAGTTSNNLSAVTFANSNGITFGLNASTLTASHNGITSQTNQTLGLFASSNTTGQSSSSTVDARSITFVGHGVASVGFSNGSVNISVPSGGAGDGVNIIAAGTQTANTTGTVLLQNSNGISFGMSNSSVVTASYTVPSVTQYFSKTNTTFNGTNISGSLTINTDGLRVDLSVNPGGGGGNTGSISAGTTRLTLGEAVFANSNGISFGVNGQTVTGSVATSLTNINVSAGTTSNNLSAVTFNNGNNVSFGLNGSVITASVVSSLTAVNISAGTTSNNASAFTLANSNGLAFGLNNGTITGSYTVPVVPPVTNSSWTVSDSATSGTVGQLAFTNLNGVTLSLSSGIGGSHTIVGSVVPGLTNIRVSAGTTSNLLSAMTFANGSNVSFGINGSTITASVNTSLTAVNVSAGTTSNNLSAITFSNGSNVSFGLNGSVITASVNTSLTAVNVSAGTTSNNLSAITFSNANNFSFGLNGSVVTGSYTVPTVTNSSWTVSDAGTSGTVARLAFTNLNGITLSLSSGAGGSHTIVGSYTVPGTLSVFAQSNTTQSSSGTIAFNSLQFNGAGIASVGVTNGSVVISVPAGGGGGDGGVFAGVSNVGNTAGSTGTVSTGNFVLVGSNGISLSQSTGGVGSAATVTIYDAVLSNWVPSPVVSAAGSVAANSSMSIVPFILQRGVSASQIRFYASANIATTANTSSAGWAIGWSGVIYSNNAGTLSSINSFSNSISTFYQSNSTSSVTGVRALTASFATASLFSAGKYWLALNVTTTTSGQTSLAKSLSMGVVPTMATGFGTAAYFGGATTNTRGVFAGLGIHSTGATMASIAFTNITGHSGNSASLANLWFELANQTVW